MLLLSVPVPYPHVTRRRTHRYFSLFSSSRRLRISAALSDSLRILEWDKLCDSVASFAGTPLGRQAAKLRSTDVSFEQSQALLRETEAAVQLIDYGAGLDFAGLDAVLVKSAIDHVCRDLPVDGIEAMAVVSLIQYAETLQVTLKTAVKEDADWYNRFMPLTEVIMDFVISRPFAKSVRQVIDEDGSVKDSASFELKRSRDQVQHLERKPHIFMFPVSSNTRFIPFVIQLNQLMDKLIRKDKTEAASMEACNINGRWCIKMMTDQSTTFDGLLLFSGSGVGSLVEPIAAVSLNDELQQAKLLVAKAEEDVLSRLTDKMMPELDNIRNLLESIVRLDIVAARAKYGIAYGGTYPHLFMPSDKGGEYTKEAINPLDRTFSKDSISRLSQKDWKLYMPKAYHPLLLQQYRENLHKARKDVSDATTEIRKRRLQGKVMAKEEDTELHLASAKLWVSELESHPPIPVDFIISANTGALVITGPNTGGKTISLKTVGLASLMAKAGLYVLASEPVKIPWFDAIYADIGDEQSLTQSLSTFSGHLKQISAIRSQSTNKSLVLLDEVGAGTNPLEGAALGMALLECFAKSGSLLTIATTHHGELKTLKYSNDAFENACVEFDEVSLKPTYKILWGVPGRSNAINVAERIGLPRVILDSARKLHGTSSAEINGVIIDMETFKQEFQNHLQEAHDRLMLSRKLREDLLVAKQKIAEHKAIQRQKKSRRISESAAIARSILRNKLQQFREYAMTKKSEDGAPDNSAEVKQSPDYSENFNLKQSPSAVGLRRNQSLKTSKSAHEKKTRIPEIGEMVFVPSLSKHAMVLKMEESKGEVIVKASNIKLRLKLSDIVKG